MAIPAGAELPELGVDVDKLPRADVAEAPARRDSDAPMLSDDCAATKPKRVDTITDLENILIVVLCFFSV